MQQLILFVMLIAATAALILVLSHLVMAASKAAVSAVPSLLVLFLVVAGLRIMFQSLFR